MRVAALSALALLFASPAFAQDCDRSDETQMGLNLCAAADYRASDARLNRSYGEIVKRLAGDPDGRKRLQAAQRAWIAFRDAECEFVTADFKDGSIWPLLNYGCLKEQTDARVEALGRLLHCEEGDTTCPVPAAAQ